MVKKHGVERRAQISEKWREKAWLEYSSVKGGKLSKDVGTYAASRVKGWLEYSFTVYSSWSE